MSLTELQIKRAKPRAQKYALSDSRGLLLEIHPNGKKFWVIRLWIGNKELRRHIGTFPEMSLKQARVMAASERFTQPEDKITFGEIASEWLTRRISSKSPGYVKTIKLRLNKYILPALGDCAIDEITAGQILKICQKIELTGKLETASRVKSVIGQIFNYAVMTDQAEYNPVFNLRGALAPRERKHMAAITDPTGIAELMRRIKNYPHALGRSAMLFSALTFCRPGEIRHAEWSEINFDLAEWRIPAQKMKMKRPHIVPLSRQAIEVLKFVKSLGLSNRWVFSSKRDTPMSENTVRKALRSLGYSNDEMTAHGFRAMASTRLNELGWPADVIERQLAHSDRNAVRAAYNHAEHLEKRKQMMQFWGDYLFGKF